VAARYLLGLGCKPFLGALAGRGVFEFDGRAEFVGRVLAVLEGFDVADPVGADGLAGVEQGELDAQSGQLGNDFLDGKAFDKSAARAAVDTVGDCILAT
jgi:hypothetical protein